MTLLFAEPFRHYPDMKTMAGSKLVVLVVALILVGATIGAAIVYSCVALRYRRQYETMWLLEIQADVRLVEKLRNGRVESAIKGTDTFLRGAALGLQHEIKHSTGALHVLWSIKKYFHDHQLPLDQELDDLFKRVPDEEPEESIGPLL